MNKDIIISVTNLPPAAYDTLADYAQLITADLMRVMAKYAHLLTKDSKVTCTYIPSKQKTNQ